MTGTDHTTETITRSSAACGEQTRAAALDGTGACPRCAPAARARRDPAAGRPRVDHDRPRGGAIVISEEQGGSNAGLSVFSRRQISGSVHTGENHGVCGVR